MSRLIALVRLALRLLAHFVSMPRRLAGEDEGRFIDNYRGDGLAPLLAQERDLLPRLDRCIGCGLCGAVCERLTGSPRVLLGRPFALATSARSMPEFRTFVASSDGGADCRDCDRCESVCPTGVPLRALAGFVRARAGR